MRVHLHDSLLLVMSQQAYFDYPCSDMNCLSDNSLFILKYCIVYVNHHFLFVTFPDITIDIVLP